MGLTPLHPTDTVSERSRPQVGASLDKRTLLNQRLNRLIYERSSPVGVSLYPTAAEAVVFERMPRREVHDLEDVGPEGGVAIPSPWADLDEEEREQRNWDRANRRAFSESRRYFVANRLRYMWVLTFTGAGLHGPGGREVCMQAVANFVRRFHRVFGVMPYWYSPELHPGGHGWHVNFFVPKRLKHDDFAKVWVGYATNDDSVKTGTTWVSDKTKDERVERLGLPFAEALRLGAMYACKYASKDWGPENVPESAHRFVSAPGFKPAKDSISVESLDDGLLAAVEVFGAWPCSIWRSSDCEGLDGPSVLVLRFSHPVKGVCDG